MRPSLVLLFSALLAHSSDAQLRTEDRRLLAPDGGNNDGFGCDVAVDRDQALVGAYGHSGVQPSGGAAYLYERDRGGAGAWGLVKKLVPSGLQANQMFGIRVALDGDLGVCSDNGGSVHVFARNAGGPNNWGEEKVMSFPWTPYGPALALEGELLIVGDPGASAVFVLERNLGGLHRWGLRAQIVDPRPDSSFSFGSRVSLSGSTLFVTRLPLAVIDRYVSGTALVYERDRGGPGAWGAVQTITSPEIARDMFGPASVDGDLAVVSAFAGRSGAGAAYLYTRNGPATAPWQLARTFVEPAGSLFGRSIALEGDVLVIGTYLDQTLAPLRSSASVFVRNLGGANAWGLRAKLEREGPDVPGFMVGALSGGTLLCVDETEGGFHGAAYVFDVARASNRVRNGAGTNPSCYSSVTPPRLGTSWLGVVDVSGHAHASATFLFVYARPSQGTTIRGGEILVDPTSQRFHLGVAPVAGSTSIHAIAIPPDPGLIGFTCSTQAGILDGRLVLCNALDISVGP